MTHSEALRYRKARQYIHLDLNDPFVSLAVESETDADFLKVAKTIWNVKRCQKALRESSLTARQYADKLASLYFYLNVNQLLVSEFVPAALMKRHTRELKAAKLQDMSVFFPTALCDSGFGFDPLSYNPFNDPDQYKDMPR